MNKNSWFKHYNDAHCGQLVGDLFALKDYESIAVFFTALEFISMFEDYGKRGYCSVPLARFAAAVNMKPSKTRAVLARISAVSRGSFQGDTDENPDGNVLFLSPNWLKYQETRGGKRSAKNEQTLSKDATDLRLKTEDIKHTKKIPGNKLPGFSPDFQAAYLKYPRKLNKGRGFKTLSKQIKTPEDYALLLKAIDRASEYYRNLGTEEKFIPYFSTFASSWRDWVEPEKDLFNSVPRNALREKTDEEIRAEIQVQRLAMVKGES